MAITRRSSWGWRSSTVCLTGGRVLRGFGHGAAPGAGDLRPSGCATSRRHGAVEAAPDPRAPARARTVRRVDRARARRCHADRSGQIQPPYRDGNERAREDDRNLCHAHPRQTRLQHACRLQPGRSSIGCPARHSTPSANITLPHETECARPEGLALRVFCFGKVLGALTVWRVGMEGSPAPHPAS
jgi:hypothetical protein